jgi:phosphopantothenoylcysteine decarboxylase
MAIMPSSHVTLVVGGAPLAAMSADVAHTLAVSGWTVSVVPTAAAGPWLDHERLHHAISQPVSEPLRGLRPPRPHAVVACPITFNSVNKLAMGVADTPALTVLCEALASNAPLLLVPMVSTTLWNHPAWSRNLELLAGAGAAFLDARTGRIGTQPIESGTADDVSARFDPSWVVAGLVGLSQAA